MGFLDIINPFSTKRPWDNPGGYLLGKYAFKGQNTAEPRLNAVQVSRSSYGLPLPLVYGRTRVPISLLWYGSFKAIPHTQKQSGGKGGGGGGKSTSYTYTAAMVMALCEGQITGVGNYWSDKEKHSALADLGLTLFTGAGGQATWSFLTTNAPTQAIPYDHTAYLAAGALDLGSSAAMPNLTVEVQALAYNVTWNGDAVPTDVLTDYCTDASHGCGFNFLAAGLTGVGNTYETYCIAMGFFISPQEMQQRPAVDFLREVLQITNSQAVWSQGALKIIPYADQAVTGNSRTYTPDLTPLYAFNDNDYRPAQGQEPVRASRAPPAEVFNVVRVQFLDRAIDYNVNVAEATDAVDIGKRGRRVMPTITFNSITEMAVARQVAQITLDRQLYVRNVYDFEVRPDYSLLEPMDFVSITDTTQSDVVNKLVRIISTSDGDDDTFAITAEEVLVGTATAPRYDTQLAAGYAANYNNAPGVVTTPLIIAAPPQLVDVNGGYELWIAVAGTTPAAWAGCDVYASMDNTQFFYKGTIYGPSRYGTIDATFASGSDPDTTNALQVTLADPNLQLVAGTQADADNLRSLLYVDGEIMAYQYVALDGSGGYTFTSNGLTGGTKYMRRGKYGSAIASHASGTSWMRIDDAVFRMRYDPGQIGQTIYFKFCSFNIYGRAKESLGAVSSYSHVLAATNAGQSLPGNATFVARGQCVVVGDRFFKGSGAGAWDSDVRSIEAYSGGCTLKFSPVDLAGDFMIGLNTDPLTDQSYASIDHAMYPTSSSAALHIYESGTDIGAFGTYAVGDTLEIRYDGVSVRYYQNGVLLREVQNPGKVFFADSSFFRPGAAANNAFFGALNSTPSARLIARGQCVVVGNTIQKVGGASAWDSDCYSSESFPAGCSVSWRAGNVAISDFMIGLNSDPTTDQSYTSLDYALQMSGGTWEIYESGALAATGAPYTSADVFSIRYDGQWVRYYMGSSLLREVFKPGQTLFMDSSFADPGSIALDVNFGPLTSATPSPFRARGQCKVSDANIQKVGGSNGWDSDCYSIVGYPVCHCSFKLNGTGNVLGGLNTDPTTDQSYTSIDYAWHNSGGFPGTWLIYESGTPIATLSAASLSDVAAITYDGSNVRYYLNGALQRTVAIGGLTLFFDMSFFEPGAGINSLRFGPTTNLAVVDTAQVGPEAATALMFSTLSTMDVGQADTIVLGVTIPVQPGDTTVEITAVFDLSINAGPFGGAAYLSSSITGSLTAIASVTPSQGVLRCTLQAQAAVAAGSSPIFRLRAFSADTVGTHLTVSNVSMNIEIIKR